MNIIPSTIRLVLALMILLGFNSQISAAEYYWNEYSGKLQSDVDHFDSTVHQFLSVGQLKRDGSISPFLTCSSSKNPRLNFYKANDKGVKMLVRIQAIILDNDRPAKFEFKKVDRDTMDHMSPDGFILGVNYIKSETWNRYSENLATKLLNGESIRSAKVKYFVWNQRGNENGKIDMEEIDFERLKILLITDNKVIDSGCRSKAIYNTTYAPKLLFSDVYPSYFEAHIDEFEETEKLEMSFSIPASFGMDFIPNSLTKGFSDPEAFWTDSALPLKIVCEKNFRDPKTRVSASGNFMGGMLIWPDGTKVSTTHKLKLTQFDTFVQKQYKEALLRQIVASKGEELLSERKFIFIPNWSQNKMSGIRVNKGHYGYFAKLSFTEDQEKKILNFCM